MNNQDKYKHFSAHDFICDEYFQDWIIRGDEASDNFWKEWQQQNPGKRQEIATARNLLKNIAFIERAPSDIDIQNSLAKALIQIDAIEARKPAPIVGMISRAWKVAAILILVAVTAILFFNNNSSGRIAVQTKYGEIDTVTLPDKSIIVLNANSKVSYSKSLNRNKGRELWLEGEAFFIVNHLDKDEVIEPNERFVVHMENASIEVLGTSFNVRERRGKTEIVLYKGKIKVYFENNVRPEVIMQPGQILKIDPEQQERVTTTVTNPKDYSAWTKRRLLLTNPTLKEIIEYLEDVYGKRIELSDPTLAFKRIEGPILLDSLDDALFVLSTVLNVEVIKKDQTITLTPR